LPDEPSFSPSSAGPALSLAGAGKCILSLLSPLTPETVALDSALGRIPAKSIKSTRPKPSFNQSTRDGYGVAEPGIRQGKMITFTLVGEIAAGDMENRRIRAGQAVRIMTGARIPAGCDRVIPFEECREHDQLIVVARQRAEQAERYIRHRGQDLATGRVIARAGEPLTPDHLLRLAENSWTEFQVHRWPRVAILCSGSELVSPGGTVRPGQKISGNSTLLKALSHEQGGRCILVRTADDTQEAIAGALRELLAQAPDLILTTGGMGPGKFDLMERTILAMQGTIHYNSLRVRPGKSTMFAHLNGVPLFGLPGPPPAVRLLFHELVRIALRRLQGNRSPLSALQRARLLEPVKSGKSPHLNLKGAVADLSDGLLVVRPAGKLESVNSILHLRGKNRTFARGEEVALRLLSSPYSC
jgi:molybdopterin molybdotransferase